MVKSPPVSSRSLSPTTPSTERSPPRIRAYRFVDLGISIVTCNSCFGTCESFRSTPASERFKRILICFACSAFLPSTRTEIFSESLPTTRKFPSCRCKRRLAPLVRFASNFCCWRFVVSWALWQNPTDVNRTATARSRSGLFISTPPPMVRESRPQGSLLFARNDPSRSGYLHAQQDCVTLASDLRRNFEASIVVSTSVLGACSALGAPKRKMRILHVISGAPAAGWASYFLRRYRVFVTTMHLKRLKT